MTMVPIGSNHQMDWLPGLGTKSRSGCNPFSAELEAGLNTKAVPSEVDEVQYSIVCDDCGKHFWSHSKANFHTALTAHVLHKENTSPNSPVTFLESPTASSASLLDTTTDLTSAGEADASPNGDITDQEDSGDIGDEKYSIANDHVEIGHMHDTELVHSSVPDGSTFSATVGPAVYATSPAANPGGIHPDTVDWNTRPVYNSPTAKGKNPTSSFWTNRPTRPGVCPTRPVYDRGISPTSTHGTSPTSSHAMNLFQKHFARPTMLNSDFEASQTESEYNLRRSSGVSPSSPASELLSAQTSPRSMEGGNRTGLTPTTSDLPSPNSSCATIEHPLVIFPPELYDRIFFLVTPSGNRKGPGFIMGLAEAHNAETFRAGVCERLESRGEQVGFREIVAHIPWLNVPVYAGSVEDHYHMLMIIKLWPEWQKSNWNACCQILVTLEDEENDKGEGKLNQEKPGKSEF